MLKGVSVARRKCWKPAELTTLPNACLTGLGTETQSDFLFHGFPHVCLKKRSNGPFTVLRQTIRKRLQTKLNEVKAELQRRMHEPIPEQGKWLRAVVGGYSRYYGVPMNQPALALFRFQLGNGSGIARCRGAARMAASFMGSNAAHTHLLPAGAFCWSSLSSAAQGRCHLRPEPDAGIRSSGSVEGVMRYHDPYSRLIF